MLNVLRLESSHDGTIGVFRIDGEIICWSLENRWLNNLPFRSSIPAGVYNFGWTESPKFGNSMEVQEVHGRSHILIHGGNTATDTLGCLLPGLQVGHLKGIRAVLRSQDALKQLLEVVNVIKPKQIHIEENW